MRRVGVFVAAAALLSLVGLGVASSAPRERVASQVSVGFEQSDLVGRIASPRSVCKRRRVVRVYAEPGIGGGEDMLLGKDRTNRRGRYVVDRDVLLAREHYAKVRRKRVAGLVCRGDESPHVSPDV